MLIRVSSFGSVLAFCMCAGIANAATITAFSDRTAFEAAAGSLTTETFDGYTSDQSFNGTTFDVGDFTLSSDETAVRNIIDALPVDGNGESIDGTTYLSYYLRRTTATITFDTAITAIGFDQQYFGNGEDVSSISVLDGQFLDGLIGTSGSFFGLISDTPFTTVLFSSIINDGFSVDNLSYGGSTSTEPPSETPSEVPLPASLPMILGGLAAMGLMKRRATQK